MLDKMLDKISSIRAGADQGEKFLQALRFIEKLNNISISKKKTVPSLCSKQFSLPQ